MREVFKISILSLHPSQLYINESKLQKIKHHSPEKIGPLPVIRIGGDIVLTDGPTRALHAYLSGWEEEDIHTIKDLETKIIPDGDYKKLWIERCEQIN